MMEEKSPNCGIQVPILWISRTVAILFVALIFATVLLLVCIDDSYSSFMEIQKYPGDSLPKTSQKVEDIADIPSSPPEMDPTDVISTNHKNATLSKIENPVGVLDVLGKIEAIRDDLKKLESGGELDPLIAKDNSKKDGQIAVSDWVSVELEPNYSTNLISRWISPRGEPCKDSNTFEIKFLNLDDKKPITFTTGYVHEVVFQAMDESGNPHCQGGDYFEIDLSGDLWKSRPPIKDLGNGTYSFTLQVHPNFAGNYNLLIILLFRHFEGMAYSPTRFVVDKQLRRIPMTFTQSEVKLPELRECGKADFMRGLWAGRWTRHARNDTCEISDDGRFRCLEPSHPCTEPWCKGSLGLLESNGWVYSTHCSFKLLSVDDSWGCLSHKWLLFWGDSNHVDTVRNLVTFFLNLPNQGVTRRFDMNFTNPRNESQWVRITNIFNGHWDDKSNYLGLDSLKNEGYRNLLKGYFSGLVPHIVIFNSGLHDACHWHSIRRFVGGAEYAAKFWAEIIEGVKKRGLNAPKLIFRSTITAGGYARSLAFNPHKIEAFNGILLDKLREAGIVSGVIDDFDMTWSWHFDNMCNDGVHYGRAPLKKQWWGHIGHQYFVDLMLGHVLLNVICAK